MGGWDTTGTRKHMGYSYQKEHRTNITYPGGVLTFTPQTKTDTIERAETVGLTKAGAEGLAATYGWTITSRDPVGLSGQWKVTEEKTTAGEWVDD